MPTTTETTIAVGQVWRDTYHDEPGKPGKRMIRIVGHEADGRWLTQTIIDHAGAEVLAGRKTRVKPATLLAGYELREPQP